MKMILMILLCFGLCLGVCFAGAEETAGESGGEGTTFGSLIADLVKAEEEPSDEALAIIDADVAELEDEVAASVAEHWKKTRLDPDYHLFLYGTDDPGDLPVRGRHAFVVLGFELQDGEMADELTGRCIAAAAAARAFPDSILVCSGGVTGANNPEEHTEAGLMKAYLTEVCGIEADRVYIDEQATTTEENARNTLAILQEEQIETMTIITSAYHQIRAQTLYNALAAMYRKEQGYTVEIVGNFSWPMETDEETQNFEKMVAVAQLASILELPTEQIEQAFAPFRQEE